MKNPVCGKTDIRKYSVYVKTQSLNIDNYENSVEKIVSRVERGCGPLFLVAFSERCTLM
jgi:hypothetical protein